MTLRIPEVFDDSPEPVEILGATFHVRPRPGKRKMRELRVAAGLSPYQPRGVELSEEERARLNLQTADYLVAGWEGVEGPDGQPVPATPERKLALLDEYDEIDGRIQDEALGLRIRRIAALKDEEGNSRGSSSDDGRPTSTTDKAVPSSASGSQTTALSVSSASS